MSKNIEELLQSDSDDDLSGDGAVDIDQLLDVDDDDEDLIAILRANKKDSVSNKTNVQPTIKNNPPPPSIVLPSNSSRKLIASSIYDSDIDSPTDATSLTFGDETESPTNQTAAVIIHEEQEEVEEECIDKRDNIDSMLLSEEEIASLSVPPTAVSSAAVNNHSNNNTNKQLPTPEELGLASLLMAESREQKALNPGDKSSISALQLRRNADASAGLAAMLGVEEMKEITAQLRRNNNYQQHGPGSSSTLAICHKYLAVGTAKGFVILFDHKQEIRRVLSAAQNLPGYQPAAQGQLSSSSSSSSNTAALHVTAIDALPDGSVLVSAHRSGDLLLWDTARGTILKALRDPSGCEIMAVSFLSSINYNETNSSSYGGGGQKVNYPSGEADCYLLLALSSNSSIHRHRVTKSLLTAWHVEADCLLDDKSGPVLSMAAMRPCALIDPLDSANNNHSLLDSNTSSKGSSSEGIPVDLRFLTGCGSFQFFAFGFATQTCIVQTSPEVKILFKWKAILPPSEERQGQGQQANANDSEDGSTAESLDWAWLPLLQPAAGAANSSNSNSSYHSSSSNTSSSDIEKLAMIAGKPIPCLARGRGRKIELLAMRASRLGPLPSAPSIPNAAASASASAGGTAASNTGRRSSFLGWMGATAAAATAGLGGIGSSSYGKEDEAAALHQLQLTFSFPILHSYGLSQGEGAMRDLKWTGANGTMLLVLTSTGQALLLDQQLVVIERLSSLPGGIARSLQWTNSANNEEGEADGLSGGDHDSGPAVEHKEEETSSSAITQAAGQSTMVVSVVSYSQHVHMLLPSSLHRATIRSPLDQVSQLIASGRWLEGLARLVDAAAKSPPLIASETENIRRFVLNYALLAVKRSSSSSSGGGNNHSNSHSSSGRHHSINSQSQQHGGDHFQLVAGVCVEYCLATHNLDLLFGELLELFRAEDRAAALLEALEPFILSGSLSAASLPPRVIAEFLTVAQAADRLRSIERCVAYFDPLQLDLNFVLRFLYRHKMFSSFLFVYAHGLGDFGSALQLVFAYLAAQAPPLATRDHRQDGHVQQLFISEQAELGYKLLLFSFYAFTDRAFPRGITHVHSIAVVWQLLQLLIAEQWTPASFGLLPSTESIDDNNSNNNSKSSNSNSWVLQARYPLLSFFCQLDAPAMLTVLQAGIAAIRRIVATVLQQQQHSETPAAIVNDSSINNQGTAVWLTEDDDHEEEEVEGYGDSSSPSSPIMRKASPSADHKALTVLAALFRFTAYYEKNNNNHCKDDTNSKSNRSSDGLEALAMERFLPLLCELEAAIPIDLLSRLISFARRQGPALHLSYEQRLKALAERQTKLLSRDKDSRPELVAFHKQLCQGGFYLAALAMFKGHRLSSSLVISSSSSSTTTELYSDPLRHYLSLAMQSPSAAVELPFMFATQQLAVLQSQSRSQSLSSSSSSYEQQLSACRSAIARLVPELAAVDIDRTASLIKQQLSSTVEMMTMVVEAIKGGEDSLQLSLLRAVLRRESSSNDHHHHRVAEQLQPEDLVYICRLHARLLPDQLLSFLASYKELCPLDECLSVAKDFGVHEAVSFLLERAGDSEGALAVLMKDLALKIKQARRDLDAALRQEARDTNNSSNNNKTTAADNGNKQGGLWAQLLLQSNQQQSSSSSSQGQSQSSSSSSSSSSGQQMEQLLVSRLPACKALMALGEALAALCERQQTAVAHIATVTIISNNDNNQEDNTNSGQRFWFRAFDFLLHERQALRQGPLSSAGELVAALLSRLLRHFAGRMRQAVAAQQIVARVLAAGQLRLGEFRDVLQSMLVGQAYELSLQQTAVAVAVDDSRQLQRKRVNRMRRGQLQQTRTASTGHADEETTTTAINKDFIAALFQSSSAVEGQQQQSSSYSSFKQPSSSSAANKRRGQAKISRLKDMRSMTGRAIEGLGAQYPLTAVPMDGSFGLELSMAEPRRPGYCDDSRARKIRADGEDWQ